MANNFSDDDRCKALWRFESGALTTDSKGSNTLTAVNTPTAEIGDYKEGAASTKLVYASDQFYKIADADLDAGFPLSDGDTVKKATFCFFAKPVSYASNTVPQTLIGYGGYVLGSLKFFVALAGVNQNNLILYWGYNTGNSFYTYDTGIQLSKDAWWHIAIRIDGVNKVLNVRAWKYSDSTQKTYSTTPGNEMNIEATELRIGGTMQSDTAYQFDGLLDELVVFNDLLSDDEIDQIRQGTFGAAALVVADLSHAQSLQSPVLTQKHTLVVQSLSHAHVAGEPILQLGTTSLVLAGLAHENSLSTPVLTQLHNLAAENVAHAQVLGAPVLTQLHTIALQNLIHVNELGSLSLAQLHNLALENAAHIMSLDAPALTRIVILAIQNAIMGQELGSLSLTQLHYLAIQDALKAHALTSPALTQLHNIIVNALAHLNTLEAPILVHIGEILFTKGSYVSLPVDNENLSVDYTEQNVLDVASDNDTRVGQVTYGGYALHQFKKLVAGNKATIKSNVRSNIAGGDSAIFLQVYNHNLDTWETIDSDSTTGADTDFNLEAVIVDLTNYKSPSNLISCRVYQEAA